MTCVQYRPAGRAAAAVFLERGDVKSELATRLDETPSGGMPDAAALERAKARLDRLDY